MNIENIVEPNEKEQSDTGNNHPKLDPVGSIFKLLTLALSKRRQFLYPVTRTNTQ